MEKFYTCDMCKKVFKVSEAQSYSIDVVEHRGILLDKILQFIPGVVDYVNSATKKKLLCVGCHSDISAVKFPDNEWGLFLKLIYLKKEESYKIRAITKDKDCVKFTLEGYYREEDEKWYRDIVEVETLIEILPETLRNALKSNGESIDVTDIINTELNKLERVNKSGVDM